MKTPGSAERTGNGKIIQINQDMIRKELGDLVKGTVTRCYPLRKRQPQSIEKGMVGIFGVVCFA